MPNARGGHGGHGDLGAAQLVEQVGVQLFPDRPDDPASAAAWQECLRTAQRIWRSGSRNIGLLPASAQIGSVGVGLNVTLALHELSGRDVAYVDANLRWPALTLTKPASAREDTGGLFTESWLRDGVALILPRQRLLSGAGLAPLQATLRAAQRRFAAMVVDLTGWKRLGDHLSVFDSLDGVAVVARVGVSNELELLRLRYEIPESRYLGIVLTGAPVIR
jgi:hypothetical protein